MSARLMSVIAVAAAPLLCVSAAQEHAGPRSRQAPDVLAESEGYIVDLYRDSLPTVVKILTTRSVKGSRGGAGLQRGVGTGVLISSDCHVLTAAHVVARATEIVVRTQDGELRKAELLFSEPEADIALLSLVDPDPALPHARLGDSDRLAVGQSVYVIGNPRGLDNSLSVGHISGFREFGQLYDGTILAEFIQTDAAINSGNSGGPVFDSQGSVIGIAAGMVTHSGGSEGLGFVVAINTAKQLLALEERPWIGIEAVFLDSEELGVLLNMDRQGGLLVQHVTKNGPADRAGLRGGTISAEVGGRRLLLDGDLILALGGQEACHSECLISARKLIARLDQVPVTFLRQGKMQKTVVDVSSNRKNFLSRLLVDDPVAGRSFFERNGCGNCHGEGSGDPFGSPPSIRGLDSDTLLAFIDGTAPHTGGTVDGVTPEDASDLAIFLARSK